MGRNSELIRQWTLLRQLAAVPDEHHSESRHRSERHPRGPCVATPRSAPDRRLSDLRRNGQRDEVLADGSESMGALARSGLTIDRAVALYFSRALLECFAGTPLLQDLHGALDKFEAVLSPAMKKFLDRLPRVISREGAAREAPGQGDVSDDGQAAGGERGAAGRVDALPLGQKPPREGVRRSSVPARSAQGGLYLIAFVPAYSEVRTFAVERVRRATLQEQTFRAGGRARYRPVQELARACNRGPATKVQLRFHPQIAASIKERTWHASQRFKDRSDGSVVMTLEVSDDYALRSWLLGLRQICAGLGAG